MRENKPCNGNLKLPLYLIRRFLLFAFFFAFDIRRVAFRGLEYSTHTYKIKETKKTIMVFLYHRKEAIVGKKHIAHLHTGTAYPLIHITHTYAHLDIFLYIAHNYMLISLSHAMHACIC